MFYYQRIKDLRIDNDWPQKHLAEILNTTQQQYSKYELGKQEISAHHLITLSKLYKTSVDFLLGITDISAPYSRKR